MVDDDVAGCDCINVATFFMMFVICPGFVVDFEPLRRRLRCAGCDCRLISAWPFNDPLSSEDEVYIGGIGFFNCIEVFVGFGSNFRL